MRRARVTTALAALLVAPIAVTGCGERHRADPPPAPEVTAADSAVRLVGKSEADLVLFVSNQSFDDEVVHLTVAVDGVTVVSGDFDVEGQHNWVSFPLAMAPGNHEITAESDSGATLRAGFRISAAKTSYAVIDHWVEHDAPELTWQIQRQPIGFA